MNNSKKKKKVEIAGESGYVNIQHERDTNNRMPLLCGGLQYFASEGQLVLGVK